MTNVATSTVNSLESELAAEFKKDSRPTIVGTAQATVQPTAAPRQLSAAQPVAQPQPAAVPRAVPTSLPALKGYKDIHNSGQSKALPFAEIRVGGHYMIESAMQPLASVHPDKYIWRVIGFVGTRVLAVPAYSFIQGEFVDNEFPKVASYVVEARKHYSGTAYDVASFFDANGTVNAIEEQAKRAGSPRQPIVA